MKLNPNVERGMCNVLIAEGSKLLREGLCALLERHEEIRIAGEVEDGRAALAQYKAQAADVLVMTVAASPRGGIDLVRMILDEAPTLRVVVLTVDSGPQFLRELLATGIHGCLNKDASATQLVEAIREVMTGRRYVSPKLVDAMAAAEASVQAQAAPLTRPLAPREREILARIAGGESTKQIASALGVGTKTVETHRRRLMQKLNMHTIAELTKYAVIHGLTPLEPA